MATFANIFIAHLDEPRQKLPILDERMPLGQLPIHVLESWNRFHADAAKQDDNAAAARGDETKDERVLASTVVTLQDGIAKGALWVELDLVGPGSD